ncbi:MAG: phosphate ABC transporter permease PstA [Planctomycetota bacterium]|nr:phosphate ABC transporter permease PstA [Planctomycetota bacterium]
MSRVAEPTPPTGPASGIPGVPGAPATPAQSIYRTSRGRAKTSLFAHGEPMVWLTGGALALAIFMILGLLSLIFVQGMKTFWPAPVVQVRTHAGATMMGEVTRVDHFVPTAQNYIDGAKTGNAAAPATQPGSTEAPAPVRRRLIRTGNFELTNTHYTWVSDFEIAEETLPAWAMVVERTTWGRFYGVPEAFLVDGKVETTGAEETWKRMKGVRAELEARLDARHVLETDEIGRVNGAIEAARLALHGVELREGASSPAYAAEKTHFDDIKKRSNDEFAAITVRINDLNRDNDRYKVVMRTAAGQEARLVAAEIVRAYPANQLSFLQKVGVYLSRWWEFLWDEPREANSEGGVFPAIFGTIVMTLLMSVAVVPLGVLAALYLREYARAGLIVSMVRIAVNNLAGVPSIVFGVFGLGFFCYIIGAGIDQVLFETSLPNPTFGKGGLLWASFTLALLTLPVVIVATEEALAAVPGSMREGSYACGASKWQTIHRIVLPRALPGIMTGMILAMARGAGEVAPLMLVGAVKLAPELPIDATGPFIHPQRSFMHLGFHIFDLAFQSPNSEAAKPMVFTTTLLLIALVAALNITAIWIRTRLRRKFVNNQF